MIFGVDTGATGAVAYGNSPADIAVFDLEPEELLVARQTRNVVDVRRFTERLYQIDRGLAVAFIEAPVVQRVNGTIVAAQTHTTFGLIRGALLTLGVRVEVIEPQAWYRFHGLTGAATGGRKGATRQEAAKLKRDAKLGNVARAAALFPHLDLYPPVKGARRLPYFDRADAALIWSYAHSILGGAR